MAATPPPRGSGTPWSRAQVRRCLSTAAWRMRATPRHNRGATPGGSESEAAGSTPTAVRARQGALYRPGAPHVRPCAARRSSGRTRGPCRRRPRAARLCNRRTRTARSRQPGSHTAETHGTRGRRTEANRRRRAIVRRRRGTFRRAREQRRRAPKQSGSAERIQKGARGNRCRRHATAFRRRGHGRDGGRANRHPDSAQPVDAKVEDSSIGGVRPVRT